MGFFQSNGILNRRGFFGGSAAFSPTNIAGLQLWLDATTGLFDATSGGSEVTTDGSAVARWEDQSGNGRHIIQATVNDRPILKTSIQNSKNILRFDGTSDYLSRTDAFVYNFGSATIFCVVKSSPGLDARLIAEGSSTSNVQIYAPIQAFATTASKLSSFIRANSSAVNLAQQDYGTAFDGTFRLVGCVDTGSNYAGYVNKISSLNANYTRTTTTLNRFSVGCLIRNTLSNFFSCDLGEVIIYGSALSTTDRQSVENYLYNKWAIT
jgi:hypothetical protein